MKVITKEEFDAMLAADKYLTKRWGYIGKVAEIVNNEKPQTVFELGAYKRPIVLGCDTMGLDDGTYNDLTYVHDATVMPWPIDDDKYDMFIGLQVFEHLDTDPKNYEATGKQAEAFGEVMRVSRSAILSFPYKWTCPGNHHHNITDETISEWTHGIEPDQIIHDENRIVTPRGIRNLSRVIYFWKFDNGMEDRQQPNSVKAV